VLRSILIGLSGLVFVGAAILFVNGVNGMTLLYVWVAIQAAIILIALLAERGRYRAPTADADRNWQRTAERFQDPTTGQWIIVEYNARTGERRYVPEERA
jgi:hypothetical protein